MRSPNSSGWQEAWEAAPPYTTGCNWAELPPRDEHQRRKGRGFIVRSSTGVRFFLPSCVVSAAVFCHGFVEHILRLSSEPRTLARRSVEAPPLENFLTFTLPHMTWGQMVHGSSMQRFFVTAPLAPSDTCFSWVSRRARSNGYLRLLLPEPPLDPWHP